MKTERWRQIEKLYYDARKRDPGQLSAFLDQACAGDEALRKEVESLLARKYRELLPSAHDPQSPRRYGQIQLAVSIEVSLDSGNRPVHYAPQAEVLRRSKARRGARK